jgi:peptide/nickel transport system ATP-binding protein/oligopeptide transport system ATP-binding protein
MDTNSSLQAPLLQVEGLTVGLAKQPTAKILNNLTFELAKGEVLALVGESGCGKSLTSMAILGLLPAGVVQTAGEIFFLGQPLSQLSAESRRQLRGRRIALIPQDPMTSLNPVLTVGNQLAEVMQVHLGLSNSQAWQRAAELTELVQLPQGKQRLKAYPYELSGGMRQRIMIAMALSCNPDLLIADEPTTALDVTVQAQLLVLLRQLQTERNMGLLFITHDLGVVAELANRVIVMYAGQRVEEALVATLYSEPQHPYTQGLLASVPRPGLTSGCLQPIAGQPPLPTQRPTGCSFHPRCPKVSEICREQAPAFTGAPQGVACWVNSNKSSIIPL